MSSELKINPFFRCELIFILIHYIRVSWSMCYRDISSYFIGDDFIHPWQ